MLGERFSNGMNLTRLSAKLTLAAVLSTGLTAVVATPRVWAQAAQTAGRSDSDIQSDVAYALANSKSLKDQQITAATIEGDVTISGNVRDEASKELAESLMYRVNGVRSVTNNLTVGAAALPDSAQAGNQPANPNANQQQDPNYDPASRNMAQVPPDDAGQGQPPPVPDQGQGQMPSQQDQGQYAPPPPSQAGQYPSQNQAGQYPGYGPGNSQQPQGYAQAAPQQPVGPVTIPSGTLLQIRTSETLDSTRVKPGQVFQATVAADVYQGGVLALPRGAVITGQVIDTKTNKGDLAGKQGFQLGLTNINLNGQIYPLPTDAWTGQGPGKGGYSAANTVGGAGVGAFIGALAGGGAGAAIGAGVGGLVGAGASAATNGPRMFVPAEAVLNFHLTAPLTVTPVSPQEAQRLASTAYPGRPQLRPRYGYPYGYPPPPPAYYYGYRYPVAYGPGYYYRY